MCLNYGKGSLFTGAYNNNLQLLTRDPERRLGSGEQDALDVMAHPYFRNVNFDDILNKRVPPPFLPALQSTTDTSNFEEKHVSEVLVLTPVQSGMAAYLMF
jgi:novel protein kinase C epsilon type